MKQTTDILTDLAKRIESGELTKADVIEAMRGKSGHGRPITGDTRREATIQIRLTEDEREAIRQGAQKAGETVTSYIIRKCS